jgi:hypothetical protein
MRRKTWYLIGFFLSCTLSAAHEMLMYWRDTDPGDGTGLMTRFVAVLFLVLWVESDSRGRSNIYRPFEFGYLLLFLWLPYLPYYLWKTRRWRGMALLGAFVVSLFAGYLGRWVLYAST